MTGPERRALWLGTLLLLALPLSPLPRAPWNALVLALLGGLWLWAASRVAGGARRRLPASRGRRGGLLLAAAGLLVSAALALLAPWLIERTTAERSDEIVAAALQERWTELWSTLDAEAGRAADALEVPATRDAERLRAFDTLEHLVGPAPDEGSEGERGRPTLLLVDPDGEAVAWAGEGLLNEPEPSEILPEGFDVSASFGSATLLAVRPLGDGRSPWRVIAGRSFRTDDLPFTLPAAARVRLGAETIRWSVARPGTPLPPAARTVAPEGLPMLVWLPPDGGSRRPGPGARPSGGSPGACSRCSSSAPRSSAAWASRCRSTRRRRPGTSGRPAARRRRPGPPRRAALTAVVGAGLAAAALASGGEIASASVLFGGFALAGLAIATAPGLARLGPRPTGRLRAFVVGAAGMIALLALDRLLIGWVGRFDLAARMWPGVDGLALKAGVAAAAFGALLLVHGRRGGAAAGPGREPAGESGRGGSGRGRRSAR